MGQALEHTKNGVDPLGLIAGKGSYPDLVMAEARRAGVERIVMAAFEGETAPEVAAGADQCRWMRVGQLGRLLDYFREAGVRRAMMAGQITPGRLFDLRPDWKALWLLARLERRNAESLFGAVAGALAEAGVELLPATTYLERHLAGEGHLAGPGRGRRVARDLGTGWGVAKAVAAMDVGQCVVVKKGTVLAVEGYDGTNATIRRGGALGGGGATLVKVGKPGQDPRFDVPVLGPDTLRVAAEAGVDVVVCEAKKTLLLGGDELRELARRHGVSLWGHAEAGAGPARQ